MILENSKRIAALTVTLLLSNGVARAAWNDRSGELPGLHSGKSIAIWSAALGGGAVGGLLLYKKLRGGNPSEVEFPGALSFSGGSTVSLLIRNRGKAPISISELAVHGRGFEVGDTATPILVRAGESVEVPVTMNSGGGARLHVTFVESGRERTSVVKLSGKPVTRSSLRGLSAIANVRATE
jgi:hypothetical protein